MKDFHKKESPFQGITGLAGGATGLRMSSAATKTYIDEVFSTFLYEGTGSSFSVNNGIDLAGEGGLTWFKYRDEAWAHALFDSERGITKGIESHSSSAEYTVTGTALSSYNSDGFSVGTDTNGFIQTNNKSSVSWTWRKTEKFFDIVKVTGNSDSTQQVAHNLGTIPGCMMLKKLSASDDWGVYHRGTDSLVPQNEAMFLNTTSGVSASSVYWNNTSPTSTHFTLGSGLNEDGEEYIVYLFAGGKGSSDNAVDFDGDDYLSMPVSNSDFDFGASDSLTLEAFVNMDDLAPNGGQGYNSILNRWGDSSNYCWGIDLNNSGNIYFYFLNGSGSLTTATSSGASVSLNEWYHLAVVKDGTTGRFFVNGKACGTFTWDGGSTNSSQPIHVGNLGDSNAYPIDGSISNARITMGQALYTTDFNVSHDPLTQTSQGAISSNVKLLCCNQSTVTGSTVAPSTISAGGNPTAVTNASIFDDSNAYFLGEDGDKSAIRCGAYIGNGSSTGPKIDLGWQPQWLMIKRVSGGSNDWNITDTMRGFTAVSADDLYLRANETVAEFDLSGDSLTLNSTGFSINYNSDNYNASGKRYLYIAIRGTDGCVAKPAEAGTDVFAMDVGSGNGSGGSISTPDLDSGFPVDFGIVKQVASANNWDVSARIMQRKFVRTNSSVSQQDSDGYYFDSNVGWGYQSWLDSSVQSWMWKRGQGFDVLTWTGTDVARTLNHSMNSAPEMMWVKNRSQSNDWMVYHKGLNGGTNPEQYYAVLNSDAAEVDLNTVWNDTAPTSSVITLGTHSHVNGNGDNFVGMIFSSVTGISKVGSFVGNGTSQSISLGFQPRFLILKNATSTEKWYVLDTVRGWDSTSDAYMSLNTNYAQVSSNIFGEPTATGFDISGSDNWNNANGETFIYYAHA